MSQTIKLKRSSVTGKAPTTTDLELGELAINTFDGKLFIKKDDGTTSEIIEVGSAPVGYNNTNWDAAYGWGDHGSAGYLTNHQDISGKANLSGDTFTGPVTFTEQGSTFKIDPHAVGVDLYSSGNLAPHYQTTFTLYTGNIGSGIQRLSVDSSGNLSVTGTLSASGYNKSNWDTAYGWGDHALAGYLTSLPSHVHTIANVTGLQSALNGKVDDGQVLTNVPAGAVFTDTVYSLPEATATTRGGIEIFSNTDQTVGANAVSATAGRTYGIQLNSAGQAVVNVPWVDTNTNTWRPIHDTPVDGATTTSISSNWAFDNVKTAVPTGALFTDTVYTHPSHPGDDISIDTGPLSGATVISDLDFNVTTDTLGHVTDANATISTRNLTAADVGAAAASHNHDGRYYTETESDSRYVNVTGDTMTGRLINSTTGRSVTVGGNPPSGPNATVATQTSYLEVAAGSGSSTGSSGLIFHNPGISTSVLEYVNTNSTTGYFNFKSDDTSWEVRSNNNKVWHAGNDGSGSGLDADTVDGLDLHTGRNNQANKVVRTDASGYIQAGWINTTSGVTTGTNRIYASNDGYIRYVTNDTFRNNLGLWWTGNDGSGSGLDADLLDGQHGSYYAPASHSHSLTLSGDVSGSGSVSGTISVTVNNDSHSHSNYMPYGTGGSVNVNSLLGTVLFTGSTGGWSNRGPSGNNAGALLSLNTHPGSYYSQLWFDTAGSSFYHRTANNTTPTASWRKVWDAGNDGSGSGLDADLLDGQHGSYYAPATHGHTLTLNGDVSGSGSVSGTISVTVNNDSHSHSNYMPIRNSTPYTVPTTTTWGSFNLGNGTMMQASGTGRPSGSTHGYWFVGGKRDTAGGYAGLYFNHYSGANGLFVGGHTDGTSAPNWERVWTSNTDGSGSGLDADLLDGQHASAFLGVSAKAADSNLLDGIDSSRFVYGSNSTRTTSNTQPSQTLPSGFYDVYNSNTPTSTWYSWINIRHNNTGNNHGHQIAGSFYDTNLWSRNINNNTYGAWTKKWDTANDGSGSGLDADLLDGQHASAFLGVSAKAADSNLLDGIDSGSFLRSDATDYLNGVMYVRADIRNETAYRDHGVYGDYDSYKTNHIWSMGSSYRNSTDGSTFGTLYGLAYKHTNNATGGTMGGGHQMVWCNNGSPRGAIGYDRVWHASGMRVGSSDVWHGGNDGSGSGLDADLLDGQQGSYYAPASHSHSYLPLTGGTLTGGLSISGYNAFSSYSGDFAFLTLNNSTVWGLTNDGAGSGLDADLLDGQQGSYYAPASHTHSYLPLSGGSLTGNLNLPLANAITFYGDASNNHSIMSRSWTGGTADDLRINSYGGITLNLDSNNNNSSGKGLIIGRHGASTGSVQKFIEVAGETCWTQMYDTSGGTGFTYMSFKNTTGATTYGSIYRAYSSITYATSSDYRLKENIVALTGASERLKQIPAKRFNFIEHPERTVDGFIAHEVQEIVPEAVVGEKDALDEEGNPVYQGVDQSKLVPLLVASLQEALAEIDNLKARVSALEN